MSAETLLLLIAIVFVVVSFPAWPYSKSWGYKPAGILAVLLAVFLVWAIAGNRPLFRRSVGHDIRSTGRDAADSLRDAFR